MQIILNEQGYVSAYALIGSFGTPSITVDEPIDIDDFENNYRSYYLSEDNKLVKSDSRQAEINNERELNNLRSMREKICFPCINRGDLWYSRLSAEQRYELDVWYEQWLNITTTRVIPEKPDWLIL